MTNRLQARFRTILRGGGRLLAFGAFVLGCAGAGAAERAAAADLDGVTMPDLLQFHGSPLRLNGMGLRTYSLFRVHVYVAGLYLDHPTGDAKAILRSGGVKLLRIRFQHDVSAEQARKAWADGFADNCRAPCHLPKAEVDRFLAQVPDFRSGDESTLLFQGPDVEISVNGHSMGVIDDPVFTRAILATFIGDYPPTEPLKHGLLGLPN